jgi:hypothetical protein
MWSAYLDGELTASEAAEFDQSLSDDDRQRLTGEVRLEQGLADALSRGGACPIEVWKRTCAAIQSQSGTPANVTPFSPRMWRGMAALAAAVLVVVGLVAYQNANTTPEFLQMEARTVTQLAETAEIPAGSVDELNRVLHDTLDIHLTMRPLDAPIGTQEHVHPRSVVGAHHVTYRGEDVVELLFNCCSKPVKMVVMPEGSAAAHAVGTAVANGEIQAVRDLGGYVVALVGEHEATGLLDFLTDDWENAARHA